MAGSRNPGKWGALLAAPPLPPGHGRVAAAFAMPGEGKTELMRLRVAAFPRSIQLDSQVVFGEGEYPGLVVWSPEELGKALKRLLDRERWRISYRGEVTESVWSMLLHVPRYLLTVEEADKYCDGGHCPDTLYRMAHHGRRAGQAMTLISRRPANIAKDLTATIEDLYVFMVNEPADVLYFKKRGVPLEVMDSMEKHDSLRRFRGENGRMLWSICRCRTPHLGPCAPIKGGKDEEDGEDKDAGR